MTSKAHDGLQQAVGDVLQHVQLQAVAYLFTRTPVMVGKMPFLLVLLSYALMCAEIGRA